MRENEAESDFDFFIRKLKEEKVESNLMFVDEDLDVEVDKINFEEKIVTK